MNALDRRCSEAAAVNFCLWVWGNMCYLSELSFTAGSAKSPDELSPCACSRWTPAHPSCCALSIQEKMTLEAFKARLDGAHPVSGNPVHGHGDGWAVRSLPNQTVLWFCEQPFCTFGCWCCCKHLLQLWQPAWSCCLGPKDCGWAASPWGSPRREVALTQIPSFPWHIPFWQSPELVISKKLELLLPL